jgi:hypothetical protein
MQCQHDLNSKDLRTVPEFESPDDLTKDLKNKADKVGITNTSRFFTELAPTLKTITKVSNILLIVMGPTSIEMKSRDEFHILKDSDFYLSCFDQSNCQGKIPTGPVYTSLDNEISSIAWTFHQTPSGG